MKDAIVTNTVYILNSLSHLELLLSPRRFHIHAQGCLLIAPLAPTFRQKGAADDFTPLCFPSRKSTLTSCITQLLEVLLGEIFLLLAC